MVKKSPGIALLAALLLYLAIALAVFFPLAGNATGTAPGGGAVSYTNLWSFWWADYALFNSNFHLFHTYMLFYPVGVNLSLQPLAPLASVVFGPLGAFGTVFAYNITFFVGFVLSGISMLVLAFYLTRNLYGSFIAGLIFGFSAFHIAGAYTSISLIFVAWVPLFVYFLMRSMDSAKYAGPTALMAVSFLLAAFMGGLYQALLLELLFIAAIAAYAVRDRKRHSISRNRYFAVCASFIAVAAIASIAYAPLFKGATQTIVEQAASADLLSFFVPSYYNGLVGSMVSGMKLYLQFPGYKSAYIGYTALLLASIGAFAARKQALTKLLVLATVVSAWLALGPYITVDGVSSGLPGLFYLYSAIPYFNAMQEPYYFSIFVTLAVALLAAFGVKYVFDRWAKQKSSLMAALAALFALLILAEGSGMPISSVAQNAYFTHVTVPSIYSTIRTLPGNFSVLVLPSIATGSGNSNLYAGEASFYTSVMRKPLVGGYSEGENMSDLSAVYNVPLEMQAANLAYFNTFSYSSPVYQNTTNQSLLTLYNYGTGMIIINKEAYNQSALAGLTDFLAHIFGAPVHSGNNTVAFETAGAINASIYRSFVAYPELSEWSPETLLINASTVQMWQPSALSQGNLYGAITVYAPYEGNATSIRRMIETYQQQRVVAQIGFNAYSSKPSIVVIGMMNGSTTKELGAFNTTSNIRHYELNATLDSGPYGNVLFFITAKANPAYVENVTFSMG
ncbi:MAG: hypothetical protein QXW10_00955 [Candidatus Micrarchaeaceae archaeon]